MDNSVIWLLAGAALLALEAFGVPGIGFLFAGCGAILVGILIEAGLIGADAIVAQCAVFFIATTVFAVLLWNKLKKWRLNPNAPQYSNIVGTEAAVIGLLKKGDTGTVKWSGTTMRAKLTGADMLENGAIVIVTAIDGNVLTVTPK